MATDKKWIAGAIKKPGALKKELGIKADRVNVCPLILVIKYPPPEITCLPVFELNLNESPDADEPIFPSQPCQLPCAEIWKCHAEKPV